MELRLRHIGTTIIEMSVEDWGTTIKTEVTDLKGVVSEELIQNLREVADELEAHNEEMQAKECCNVDCKEPTIRKSPYCEFHASM